MLRSTLLVVLLAGCRQILGLDSATVGPTDAAADTAIPDELDRSERMKEITIRNDSPVIDLDGFPLWFAIEDPDIAARARADGSDIYFESDAGEALAYEIQHWDPSSGRLEAWVQVKSNAFELHYGEPITPAQHMPSRVFTTAGGFAAVWHFEDDFTTPVVVDATGATPSTTTSVTAANSDAGKLGAGIHMSNVSQRVQFVNSLAGNMSHTISAWMKLDATMSYDPVIVIGTPSTNHSRWMHARYATNGSLAFGMYGNDRDTGVVIPQATWTAVHWVYEGGNRTSRMFVNGTLVTTFGHNNGVNTTGATGYVGFAPIQYGPNLDTETGMNGILDEVRIQTVARPDNWIAADFASQSAPDQTYSVGPEQAP